MASKKKQPAAEHAHTSEELHHPAVAPATPEAPFSNAVLEASGDKALDVVRALPADKHEALVQAWLAKRNAAAIVAAAEEAAPGSVRKAARRALGILKSRGVAIPERQGKVVQVVPKATHSFEARAMFPDGRGTRVYWVAKVASTGSTDVVEVTVTDRGGIVGLQRGNPSAGNLRQMYQSWIGRVGRPPSEVPLAWARKKIAEAKALTIARKAVLPMGLDAAKELLEPVPAEAVPHPIDGEDLAVPTDEAAVRARLEKSMHLHEQPELASWIPDDQVAIEVLNTINSRVQGLGKEVLDAAAGSKDTSKIDTVVNAAIDEAADAYFNAERKELYTARLRDAAWSLYRNGQVDRAIDALVVAQGIARAGIVSDRPSEIGFVRGMFLKLLAVAQQRAAAMSPRGNEEAARLG